MCPPETVPSSSAESRWRRHLYERHPSLPDNFTPDRCFLQAIERNKHVRKFGLGECVRRACSVALQFDAVVLFLVCFAFLADHRLSAGAWLAGLSGLAPWAYLAAWPWRRPPWRPADDLRRLVVFVAFGLGLTPVLYKLTDTVSTDTIHNAGGMMLFLHLLAHDYAADHAASHHAASHALSLNVALFAAVCLASRLGSSLDAFALLTAAVVAFVLFPLARRRLPGKWVPAATLVLSPLAVVAAAMVSCGAAVAAGLLILCITGLAPWLFVRWQAYKDTIHGPWDEAVPNIWPSPR